MTIKTKTKISATVNINNKLFHFLNGTLVAFGNGDTIVAVESQSKTTSIFLNLLGSEKKDRLKSDSFNAAVDKYLKS